jgi:Zn-dependent protease with chaperone function
MDSVITGWLSFILTGPYSSVLPFAILPPFSWWIVRRLMQHIERVPFDPSWRMILGGVGACIPGLVTLSLLSFSIHYIPRISPGDFGCYVKIYGPLCIVLTLVARALVLWLMRSYRVRRLLALTTRPSERLLRISSELDVATAELAASVPVCMAVGFTFPRIVVSKGALAQFSDEDLRAALLHERAHVMSGDTRLSALISFLSECGVWRASNALSVHRQACEELADEEAARSVGAIALASVLVRFARRSWNFPFAEAFAEKQGLDRRVRRLLDPPAANPGWNRLAMPLALVSTASLVAYPRIASAVARSLFNCIP